MILFWNARGLGSPRALRHLHNLVQLNRPHILFLYETHLLKSRMDSIRIQLNFGNCFNVDCVGDWLFCGLLMSLSIYCLFLITTLMVGLISRASNGASQILMAFPSLIKSIYPGLFFSNFEAVIFPHGLLGVI